MTRKPAGCSIVWLIAACCSAVLVVLVGGLVAAGYASSDAGQRKLRIFGKHLHMAGKGLAAPGAAELRVAGCSQAMVIDPEELRALVDFVTDSGSRSTALRCVVCVSGDSVPECEEIAKAYLVVPNRQPGNFWVLVRSRDNKETHCSRNFSEAGVDLGPSGQQ